MWGRVAVMDGVRITYAPRSDATSEAELDALANVYAYLLKTRNSKKADKPAPEPVGRDDVRKGQDAHTATEQYTK
jgi:hypothetical protein